jgi:3D (Asp-Asp-Asp) domain-containing protein
MATLVVALLFVFLQQTATRDSRSEATATSVIETGILPQAGARLLFRATAYCKGETTASGVGVRTGIAAADPAILPVGSVVRLETPNPRYSGVWTVMDTGPCGARPHGRSVSLELQGSAAVRPTIGAPHGVASRLESGEQPPWSGGLAVPQT